ncbi:unnamed protein product, partial [Strongylus vulgaris]
EWDWPLQHNDESVKVTEDDKSFRVELDAQFFMPKEISVILSAMQYSFITYSSQMLNDVKTIGDQIQIQMDHEARGNDKTNVSRSITRYVSHELNDGRKFTSKQFRIGISKKNLENWIHTCIGISDNINPMLKL